MTTSAIASPLSISMAHRRELATCRAHALGCLTILMVLFIGMYAAMLAGVAPHPPAIRGPFIATALAMCVAATVQFAMASPSARWFGLAAALLSWPGVGLHKFMTEAQPEPLAPVLLVGSTAALFLVIASFRCAPESSALSA
jgi:hypothetical protein